MPDKDTPQPREDADCAAKPKQREVLPIKQPFQARLSDCQIVTISLSSPEVEFIGSVPNTVTSGVRFPRPELGMEHAIVRAGEKLIKASWAGPPTNRELRGVEVSREDAVNVFVDSGLRVPPALLWLPEQAPPASEPAARKLTFLPGAFVYRGHRQPLSGKPLQVLQALNEAQGKTLTLAALIDKVWPDCQTGQETIRSAIAKARRALREAITTTGEQAPADPLPAVDRGTDRTAWRLNLP